MKNFVKILLVLLVMLLVFTGVIGFMEMPVAEEGEELTSVEQWMVKLKSYLSEILSAAGISLTAVLLYIFLTIQKLSANTNATAGAASSEVAGIKGSQEEQQKQIMTVGGDIQTLSGKMDVLMELFSQTLMLSDLPAAVRNDVAKHIERYNNIKIKSEDTTETKADFAETVGAITESIEKVAETYNAVKNTVKRF